MIEQQQVGEFLDTLASRASTPGGGAVAGLAGAEAAALVAMVCHLTRNKEDTIAPVLRVAEAARRAFLQLADDDARTFAAVMTAWRLPTDPAPATCNRRCGRQQRYPLA
jgi:methenyltetrahydrofolate cyclohydrolase